MKIVYINDNGGLSVVHPAPEIVERLGMEQALSFIRSKDVPAGKPCKFITDEELQTMSRTDRAAWSYPVEELTDGVGGQI